MTAAFGSENFLESSKLGMVSLHLTGIASAWWEAQTQDGATPTHWKGFKKAFFKQKTAYEILRSDWSSDVCSSDLVRFITFNGRYGQIEKAVQFVR